MTTTDGRIRRSNALGALRELQALVSPALETEEASSERRAKLLETGFSRARARLSEDFNARLEAASAHLGQAVKREASRRFWGPAGWWMRLTLAGTAVEGAEVTMRTEVVVAPQAIERIAVVVRVPRSSLRAGAQVTLTVSPDGEAARTATAPLLGPHLR